MLNLFRYHRYRRRYPQYADYIDMGLGIEARYKRCQKYWEKHIECSRAFQQEALAEFEHGGAVAVLGAGRLYDIDMDLLLRRFETVELFDVDPTAQKAWDAVSRRAQPGQVVTHLMELSGSIEAWTGKLHSFLAENDRPALLPEAFEQLGRLLRGLCCAPPALPGCYNALLSLNLLSQIPIYWRDRVHKLVARHWDIDTDDNSEYPASLQGAVTASMGVLQQGHLKLLQTSGADCIVLTCDRCFHYYRCNLAPWQTEPALWCDDDLQLSGYQRQLQDSWLWHIAPQGLEQKEYGVIHEVVGCCYLERR